MIEIGIGAANLILLLAAFLFLRREIDAVASGAGFTLTRLEHMLERMMSRVDKLEGGGVDASMAEAQSASNADAIERLREEIVGLSEWLSAGPQNRPTSDIRQQVAKEIDRHICDRVSGGGVPDMRTIEHLDRLRQIIGLSADVESSGDEEAMADGLSDRGDGITGTLPERARRIRERASFDRGLDIETGE